MEIKIKILGNGIHDYADVSVNGAKLKYIPLLTKIVELTDEINKNEVDNA